MPYVQMYFPIAPYIQHPARVYSRCAGSTMCIRHTDRGPSLCRWAQFLPTLRPARKLLVGSWGNVSSRLLEIAMLCYSSWVGSVHIYVCVCRIDVRVHSRSVICLRHRYPSGCHRVALPAAPRRTP